MFFRSKVGHISLILALTASFLAGCATMRKLDAASILKKTHIEFQELVLDSVDINPNLFDKAGEAIKSSLLPNPQVVTMVQNLARGIIESELGKANLSIVLKATSSDEDTLWVRSFTANIALDSVIELPLSLKDSSILAPGENRFVVTTQFPLDKRLFKLNSITKYRIKGVLQVALKADGETVPLEFDIEHPISPEEIKALEDRARETLLSGIINDWVGAILPSN